jgi:hypothetical protein
MVRGKLAVLKDSRRALVIKASRVKEARSGERTALLQTHFREFYWARNLIHWQMVATCFLCFAVMLIWVAYIKAYSRPRLMFEGQPTLREAMNSKEDSDEVNMDQVTVFSLMVLNLLNTSDDLGSPHLRLLLGMVNPEIYERQQVNVEKNLAKMREMEITKTFVPTQVLLLAQDKDTGRIAVYVRGYLFIGYGRSDHGPYHQTIPYRVKLVLENNTPGKLNPFPFYLVSLDEQIFKSGAEARDYDTQVLQTLNSPTVQSASTTP